MFRYFKKSQYAKFIFGSVTISLFEYFVTIILAEIMGLNENISYGISLMLGLYLLFVYHKKITFRLCSYTQDMIMKFLTVYISIYILNWLIVFWIDKAINYKLAIPIVAIVLSILSYTINKSWVFVPNPTKEAACKLEFKR